VSNAEILECVQRLLDGDLIDFCAYSGLRIFVKNDYTTTTSLMEEMARRTVINLENLRVDEYGVVFNQYSFGDNVVLFNYLPSDESFSKAIRISHDGFVSTCYDMFFADYPNRAQGNVRVSRVSEILRHALRHRHPAEKIARETDRGGPRCLFPEQETPNQPPSAQHAQAGG
jgi:hypothetical protein